MTRDEAMTRLKRLPQGRYLVGRHTTSADRRAVAKERLTELYAQRQILNKQINDAEDAARDYKFKIYQRQNGWMSRKFAEVDVELGKGDTWEEAFEKAEQSPLRTAEPDAKGDHAPAQDESCPF